MTSKLEYYSSSAADSIDACCYHFTQLKNADEYVTAYAHVKALIFEAKSTLDSIAAALNNLFNLGVIESHVFFNKEFIDKFNALTGSFCEREHLPVVPASLFDTLVAPDQYFPGLRTYLSTSFALLEADNGEYLLSDTPGEYSFNPGVEASQYCEKLLESVKYVFYFFNELIENELMMR